MESPRKFNDCYFYYYSTCTKGDNCVFRHEPSALGCETMCAAWQQGKCLDKRCKLRHMELRKNRKQIPCYWETQPGGCRKKHCPFMHKNPEARTDGILPSQPVPLSQIQAGVTDGMPHELAVPQPAPQAAPQALPIMWQQQRQVVLDSAILGVMPASDVRRVVPMPHEAGAPYVPHAAHVPHATHVPHVPHVPHPAHAPMPVDPLVVNFEEESDNESAPSTTPTKHDEDNKLARSKSQELLLLERIQAEAAAFYSYDSIPEATDRKIVRTNLSTKYDRLSLDDLAGKKQALTERRKSLDFKVLSLDEIRARKKTNEPIVSSTPITLNLNRKRKSSTTESLTTSGDKIIKVVRSNSIVYKKLDDNPAASATQPKVDPKPSEVIRKRTLSEQIESIYDMQDDELVDNVCEFKRIKLDELTSKPVLIRNTSVHKYNDSDEAFKDDSDTEVQIVSVERHESSADTLSDSEVIDVETTKICESIDIVELSEDDDVIISDDIEFGKNVPDVVASCHKTAKVGTDSDVLRDIEELLDDDL